LFSLCLNTAIIEMNSKKSFAYNLKGEILYYHKDKLRVDSSERLSVLPYSSRQKIIFLGSDEIIHEILSKTYNLVPYMQPSGDRSKFFLKLFQMRATITDIGNFLMKPFMRFMISDEVQKYILDERTLDKESPKCH